MNASRVRELADRAHEGHAIEPVDAIALLALLAARSFETAVPEPVADILDRYRAALLDIHLGAGLKGGESAAEVQTWASCLAGVELGFIG